MNSERLSLGNLTSPEMISVPLLAHDKASALSELTGRLKQQGCLPDPSSFESSVLGREKLHPTVFPPALAIPHGRILGSGRLAFALGLKPGGFPDWRCEVGPVMMVFLFVVPEVNAGEYLRAVSGIVRASRDSNWLEGLRACFSPKEAFALLEQVALR